MKSPIGRIVLKIIELIGCIACVITKALTDQEARRVFLRNQKFSREWGLLHNVTWSPSGNAFANVTYGGFTLITTLMLISRCIDAKSRPSLIEKIFLVVGMLCFFAMGGVVFAAFDQVPFDLHDNAIILGCLSFFVAFLMLIDLADPMARLISDTTQTDHEPNDSTSPTLTSVDFKRPSTPVTGPLAVQTDTILPSKPSSPMTSPTVNDITKNGNYHRSDEIDFVQAATYPIAQNPVFEKILTPEKQRPTKLKVANPDLFNQMTSIVNNRKRHHEKPTKSPLSDNNTNEYHQNFGYIRDYSTEPNNKYLHYGQEVDPHSNNWQRPLMVVRDYSRTSIRSEDDRYNEHYQKDNYQVRNINFSRESDRCGPNRTNTDESTIHRSLQPGFVANAARMWDHRMRSGQNKDKISDYQSMV